MHKFIEQLKKVGDAEFFFACKKIYPLITARKIEIPAVLIIRFFFEVVILSIPFVYKFYINKVINERNPRYLLYCIWGFIILYFLQIVFSCLYQILEKKIKNRTSIHLKKELLKIYSKVELVEFQRYDVGDLRNRIEMDTVKIEDFFFRQCIDRGFSTIRAIVLIVILFFLNIYLAAFGTIIISVSFLLTNVIGNKLKKVAEAYRTDIGEFESYLLHSMHAWKEIKTSCLEESQEERLEERWKVLAVTFRRQTIFQYLSSVILALNVFVITRLGLYFFGGILVLHHAIDVATVLIFVSYFEQLYNAVQLIAEVVIEFYSEKPSYDRVFEILEKKMLPKKTQLIQGDLNMKNLSFRYKSTGEYLLKDINVVIPSNSHWAIIGRSGSGKTTLVKLMLGLLKADIGGVYINDINIFDLSEESRSRCISSVMQDPLFFNMSIWDNLQIVNKAVSLQEIEDACKLANIYDFIQSLPEKYDTIIGEYGIRLSGGQLQRLAIARTLLVDSHIILFDEVTSALDHTNEKEILHMLQNLSGKKTILTIAHRPSTILQAERILLLGDGGVRVIDNVKEYIDQAGNISYLYQE